MNGWSKKKIFHRWVQFNQVMFVWDEMYAKKVKCLYAWIEFIRQLAMAGSRPQRVTLYSPKII